MAIDTKSIMDKVLNGLKNDPVLSDYVKDFSHGNSNTSRMIFPYIEVGDFTYSESELNEASGILTYSVEIKAGTSSLAPGVALQGIGTVRKGIVELCEDIVKVCVNNTFNGAFLKPIIKVMARPLWHADKAQSVCTGIITLTGETWFRHE